ncbi:uncharacterized protein LOC131997676 [Stomoxys calcitrans]|uniref:uncharacterized protein LOC131997676 n=1 Tax=Stomoxys calcitrans TaxID=35570 RepID=UPI0027E23442|nr:uncharacterized protein LOC131997676 [Stomoxys calcitrans]
MLLHMVFLLSACTYWQPTQTAKRRFLLEVYNVTCHGFQSPVIMFECGFKHLAKSRFALSSAMVFNRELPRSVQVGIDVDSLPKNGKKLRKRMDLKINLCDLLNHVNLLPIVKDYMLSLYRSTNWPILCPFLANHQYNMTDLTITEENIPPHGQISQFNASILLIDKGRLFSKYTVFGALVPRS